MNLEEQLYKLNQIGIALSSEQNLHELLDKILTEARAFTSAEGASLYIKQRDTLYFISSQNEVLAKTGKKPDKYSFARGGLPVSSESMAGYAALSGEILNIKDAYHIPPERPYKFQRNFDEENDYRTQSMLLVPMRDRKDHVIGVLALINARSSTGEIISFDHRYEPLMLSLSSQAAVAYLNAQLTQKLKDAYLDTILRLSMAAECREPDIAGHLRRMSAYSAILAEELGLPSEEVENIRYASPMHDVGKIGIPDAILLKPGKLTEEEYEIMKQHALYASKILGQASSDILKLSEEIALTHHEHYDGNGYPRNLKGEEIPLAGRIVALADVFDALASRRAYKKSWEMEEITRYIRERAGSQFDPRVVDAFERRLADFEELNRLYSGNSEEVNGIFSGENGHAQ